MKQKQKSKLSLNKTTISKLQNNKQATIKGGDSVAVCLIVGAALAIAGWAFTDGVADGKEHRKK